MGNNWKNRFENAEVAPSDALWANIEAGLPPTASAKPWILTTLGIAATATLLLAASISTYFVFQGSGESSNSELVENQPAPVIEPIPENEIPSEVTTTTDVQKEIAEADSSTNSRPVRQASKISVTSGTENITNANTAQTRQENDSFQADQIANIEPIQEITIAEITLDEHPILLDADEIQQKEDAHQKMFEELPLLDDIRELKNNKKSSSKNRLWAGLYQGVGGHTSNISSGGTESSLAFAEGGVSLSDALSSEQSTTRSIDEKQVVNTALLVGVPLGDRVSLVSGFQYSKSSFTSTAGSVDDQLLHFTSDSRSFDSEISNANFQRTDLEGFYEVATVPIMADYRIFSERIKWSVQAGPSVGFLIQQKIMSEEFGLSQTSQPGEIYSPVHLRVVLGSAFIYDLNENYQISLRPALDQAVTSITKSSASFSSYPLNYSVSLGLRYQF